MKAQKPQALQGKMVQRRIRRLEQRGCPTVASAGVGSYDDDDYNERLGEAIRAGFGGGEFRELIDEAAFNFRVDLRKLKRCKLLEMEGDLEAAGSMKTSEILAAADARGLLYCWVAAWLNETASVVLPDELLKLNSDADVLRWVVAELSEDPRRWRDLLGATDDSRVIRWTVEDVAVVKGGECRLPQEGEKGALRFHAAQFILEELRGCTVKRETVYGRAKAAGVNRMSLDSVCRSYTVSLWSEEPRYFLLRKQAEEGSPRRQELRAEKSRELAAARWSAQE